MAHAWDGMFISVYDIPLGQIAPFSPPDNIPPHLGHCPCLLKRKCENRHQAVLLTLTDLSLSILYTLTVDRFMSCTVVEGGILHHVKWEGKLSGRGNVRGESPGGDVRIPLITNRVSQKPGMNGARRLGLSSRAEGLPVGRIISQRCPSN